MKITVSVILFTSLLIEIYAFVCYDEECKSSDYQSYIDCIRIQNREKRHTTCKENNDDCEICTCKSLHCCHKTCHVNCESSSCRSNCRKSCKSDVSEKGEHLFKKSLIINTNSNNPVSPLKHNITTVIHLHNIINNTNVIDVPIQINNTNINNITIPDDDEEMEPAVELSGTNKCCYISKPNNCVNIEKSQYMKCQANQEYHCGSFCSNSEMRKPIYPQQLYNNYGTLPPQILPPYLQLFSPLFAPNYLNMPRMCQSDLVPLILPSVMPPNFPSNSYEHRNLNELFQSSDKTNNLPDS